MVGEVLRNGRLFALVDVYFGYTVLGIIEIYFYRLDDHTFVKLKPCTVHIKIIDFAVTYLDYRIFIVA